MVRRLVLILNDNRYFMARLLIIIPPDGRHTAAVAVLGSYMGVFSKESFMVRQTKAKRRE